MYKKRLNINIFEEDQFNKNLFSFGLFYLSKIVISN